VEIVLPLTQLDVTAEVGEILNRRPAVGLAVGVIRDGLLESFSGHGLPLLVAAAAG
jgi:hypothetical protein